MDPATQCRPFCHDVHGVKDGDGLSDPWGIDLTSEADQGAQEGQRTPPLVRTTLRCLVDDLGHAVSPASVRNAAEDVLAERADIDTLMLVEAAELEHDLISKATAIAEDDEAHHEAIRTFSTERIVKVKTSDLRGALWRDDQGQWWLIAAGVRKDDGSGDFYQVISKHGEDPVPLLPTSLDRRWLKLEEARVAELEEEREIHETVLRCLFEAAADVGAAATKTLLGAQLSILVTIEDDGMYVVHLTWEFDEYTHQHRFPADILAKVPGRERVDDWAYQPGADGHANGSWWTLVPSGWVDSWSTAVELDHLLSDDWEPSDPAGNGSEHFSHYAPQRVVTCAYVLGIEITSLCGARVVAHRDYERFPVCSRCDALRSALRGGDAGDR